MKLNCKVLLILIVTPLIGCSTEVPEVECYKQARSLCRAFEDTARGRHDEYTCMTKEYKQCMEFRK